MAEAARPSDGSPGVDVMAEGGYTGEHFVERHRVELIKRVSNIKPILDELLRQKIISRYSYDQMKPLPTSQEKMVELFHWPLPVSGGEGKEMFYKLLKEHEPHLIHELRRTEVEAELPVRELLLETLHDLRDKELKRFNWLLLWKFFLCGFSRHLWRQLESLHTAKNLVDVMVQTWGQRSVEVTKEVLVDMNRTDLVQRLPIWGHKEDHSLVELWPELNPKLFSALVETMASAIELLLETLKDLTDGELKMLQHLFLWKTHNQYISSDIRWLLSEATDVQDVVFVIVLTCGRLSVTDTMKFLHEMNWTDLVQKLSHSSSGAQKKLSSEHRPALIQRAARKAAVRHLLLGIVEDFSNCKEFKEILTSIISQNNPFSLILSRTFGRESVVDLMLETFGLHSVDLTCEVLEMMGRSHIIRLWLSNSVFEGAQPVKASGRERETVGERAQDEPAQSESTKTSVQESLLETLEDLNDEDLEKFKCLLQSTQREKDLLRIPRHRLEKADRVEMVKLMMEAYDQQSVEVTRKVLKTMFWKDLQERFFSQEMSTAFDLSDPEDSPFHQWMTSQHSITEPHVGASKKSVQENPLDTLEYLSLRLHHSQLGGGEGSTWTGHQPIAVQMQQGSSEWTKLDPEVNSADADDAPTYRLQSKAGNYECSVSGLRWICNGTDSFKYQFCSWEEHMERMKSLQYMPAGPLMDITVVTGRFDEVHLPHWICTENNHRKTKNKILDKFAVLHINDCGDDVEKVSQVTSSHVKLSEPVFSPRGSFMSSKGPSGSCESISDSGEWTQLEPEEDRKGTDEAPTYSLQSEAGSFECSVSGLRWICNGTVSFKYQFLYMGSHEVLMERIRSLQYMPAGPLMDITVIAGKFDEVYLRHWICIENNPEILDKFAVLHIEDCGDVVEKVSQVTSSHVKLSEPVFSLKMLLVRWGFLFEVDCNVLIYKTNTDFLTLHVYLIPRDLGLQQELDKRMLSDGYKLIRKPHPEKSLKIKDRFILTADLEKAEISPETLMLRYESTDPNFFEVFIDNPETNFKLKLSKENESQAVWTCAIRKDVYQSTAGAAGVNTTARDGSAEKHFVDKHRTALINRVTNVAPILDDLIDEEVISKGDYDTIMALTTRRDRMRELCDLLDGSGRAGKDLFYKILEKKEKFLMKDLQKKE